MIFFPLWTDLVIFVLSFFYFLFILFFLVAFFSAVLLCFAIWISVADNILIKWCNILSILHKCTELDSINTFKFIWLPLVSGGNWRLGSKILISFYITCHIFSLENSSAPGQIWSTKQLNYDIFNMVLAMYLNKFLDFLTSISTSRWWFSRSSLDDSLMGRNGFIQIYVQYRCTHRVWNAAAQHKLQRPPEKRI